MRKWTASVKLQKKVLDLEAQVHALQGELRAAQAAARGTVATPGSALSAEWLPCSPAACCTAGHSDGVSVLVCHPVFDVVVSGGLDALLHVWAVQEDGLVRERTLRGHTGGLRAAAFDAAGQRLATAAQDDSVKLWSFSPGAGSQAFRTLAGEGVGCVAWVPASDHLVGGARDGTCRMWNAATGSCVQTWRTLEGPIRSLAVSPDAAALAVGGDAGVVQVWSLVSGAAQESSCSLELVAHEHAVESIEFAGVAQAARLRRKSAQAAALQGVKAQLSFGEEGAPRAAAAGGGEDLSTGPDSAAYILTAGRDNRVAVHDAETGVQVCSCVSTSMRQHRPGGRAGTDFHLFLHRKRTQRGQSKLHGIHVGCWLSLWGKTKHWPVLMSCRVKPFGY